MASNAPDAAERPFVQTSIARWIDARLKITHEERGICVISGPWGIGKTTALDVFASENELECVIVKVEPTGRTGMASPMTVIQLAVEALRKNDGYIGRHTLSQAFWHMRHMLFNTMDDMLRKRYDAQYIEDCGVPRFTFIFDEAQYLSKQAIEMLRFWNDGDRTTTPIPVGLAFVGNNEFSLKDGPDGQNILSGAVRSRALFIESLDDSVVSNNDISLFVQSRGIIDPAAIDSITHYFSQARVKRDLRQLEKQITMFKARARGGVVTGELVRSILNPA